MTFQWTAIRFVSRLSNKNTNYGEENEKYIRVGMGKEERNFVRAEQDYIEWCVIW